MGRPDGPRSHPRRQPAVRHLTISITAPGRRARAWQRPAFNIALVLDRSKSMNGEKIEAAHAAMTHAIKLLNARHYLSIVVFNDDVETLLPSTPASGEVRKKALSRLAVIDPLGASNLSAGWFQAFDETSGSPKPGVHRRIS